MSTIFPPLLPGPITTESTVVVVENHKAGVTLTVRAGTATVGIKFASDGGRDEVKLTRKLLENEEVTATAEEPGGSTSGKSNVYKVRAIPVPLPPARFEGTLYQCVGAAMVSGIEVGATIEIHQPAGTVIGTATSTDGFAVVALSPGLASSKPVVRQAVPGRHTDATYPAELLPVPTVTGRKLPPEKITGADDCGYVVGVSGTVCGATTRISRTRSGVTEYFGTGWDGQTNFYLPDELHAGDVLTASQDVPKQCEVIRSDESPKFDVVPGPVYPPLIVPPVCRDAEEVELLNARPGANFEIFAIIPTTTGDQRVQVGGGTFAKKDPKSRVRIDRVPPVPGATPGTTPRLEARHIACTKASDFSPAVTMEPLGAAIIVPKLLDPLFACAVYVRVGGLAPGGTVTVHSRLRGGDRIANPLGGEFGRTHIKRPEESVLVDSALLNGDEVWATVTACQGMVTTSDPQIVKTFEGKIQAIIEDPVYPTDTTVRANKLLTGCRIVAEVLGSGHPGGKKLVTSYAPAPETDVYVGQVFEGDQITVFAALCHPRVEANQSNTVVVKLGTIGVSVSPTSAYRNSSSSFIVSAKDPARGDMPVPGDVLFNGTKVAVTNATFAYATPSSGPSIAVQVTAPGYNPWTGAISLTDRPSPSGPPIGGGSSSGGGASGGGTSTPTIDFTCEHDDSSVTFTVKGTGYPTTPGSQVTVYHHITGIFTAFGVTHLCGGPPGGLNNHGPYTVDATGGFTATIKVVFACNKGCEVTLSAQSNKLTSTQNAPRSCLCGP